MVYFCNPFRALSSAGSEHLPYKQGVTGSNPVGPTKTKKVAAWWPFLFYSLFMMRTSWFEIEARSAEIHEGLRA